MTAKRRTMPTDEEWTELGHVWWSKWEWCPMPTAAVYAQLAGHVPGFEYPGLNQWGGFVRFGQDLRSRWLENPILGPFKLHRIRHSAEPKWSLYPRSKAFPIHIEYVNRFVESLTPESYEAVIAAALQLSRSGKLVMVSDASNEAEIGFELNGELVDRWTPQPRLIHDAEWRSSGALLADIERNIELQERRDWEVRTHCRCGCGETINPVEFRQGHGQKHRANLMRRAEFGDPVAPYELLGRGWISLQEYRDIVTNAEVERETHKRKSMLEAERRNRSEGRRKAQRKTS